MQKKKKKKKVFSVIFYFSLPVYKTKTKPKVLWNEQSSLIKNFPSLRVILNIPVVLNINEVCWNVSEKKNSCTVIDETIQNQMVYSG